MESNGTQEPTDRRAAYIAGLRTLADRLEGNPGLKMPYGSGTSGSMSAYRISFYSDSTDEFVAAVKALGGGDKSIDSQGHLTVSGSVHGLHYEVCLLRDVCELVEVGVEEYEDVEEVRPAETRTVTRTRPKVERRCPESLLALVDTAEVPA